MICMGSPGGRLRDKKGRPGEKNRLISVFGKSRARIPKKKKKKKASGLTWTWDVQAGKMQVKVAQSCLTLRPHGLNSPGNSPGQNTGVGSLSLLQGIFPIQGSDPGLLQGRQILYQLSHKKQLSELDTPAGRTEAVTVTQICRSLSGGRGPDECECPVLRLRSLMSADLHPISESVVWSLSLMN